MAYKYKIAPEFDDEFDSAIDYIISNLYNFFAAEKLAKNVSKHIDAITENPYLHPYYHDDRIADKGYRYVSIGSYILFYKIDETNKTVHIARFIYGKRDVKNMV